VRLVLNSLSWGLEIFESSEELGEFTDLEEGKDITLNGLRTGVSPRGGGKGFGVGGEVVRPVPVNRDQVEGGIKSLAASRCELQTDKRQITEEGRQS